MDDMQGAPGDPGQRPRPEVVSESVVIVDSSDVARKSWGVLLAIGIVAVIFGIIVLANIWSSVRLVAILAGLFLIFAGVMQFVGVAATSARAAASPPASSP